MVGVLKNSEFRDDDFVIASELIGCVASPIPQVQFRVLPRTGSRGKGRQFLSVRKLTAVAQILMSA